LGTATELRAQRNYAGHRLAPWLGHVMVSRQETARPLLTPGEVMQLPQDQAIVLVSGLAPVRAQKLKHYEDANFATRVLPAPLLVGGRYRDCPPTRTDDWHYQRSQVDRELAALPISDLKQDDGAEGGLAQQMSSFDESAPGVSEFSFGEECPFNDDSDAVSDRSQTPRIAIGPTTIRRGHAVTRDNDDLLPAF
jgi:type IV secretion system protein VirD4